MADYLSGLEKLGLSGLDKIDIFGDNQPSTDNNNNEGNSKEEENRPEEYEALMIFDKKYSCPCCYSEFTSKRVRTGKPRALKPDSDLRPRHKYIDTIKYDIVLCPKCGYSAMEGGFSGISALQKKMILEKVSSQFKGFDTKGDIYTYDDAMARFQLALLCSIIKMSKSSERAYICLKLAWLFRGKAEELKGGFWDPKQEELDALHKKELEYIGLAYEGFTQAYSNELFPICGMNQAAFQYLLAELARRLGSFDESRRILSRMLVEKNIPRNVKELMHDLKEKLDAQDMS